TAIAALILSAIAIVLHGLVVSPWAWTGLRAVSGLALSIAFVAIESWINERAENRVRGRVFGVYLVSQMIGMTGAQFLLQLGNPKSLFLFGLSSVIFVIAAAPLAIARKRAPHRVPPEPFGLVHLFRLSRLGAIATILSGVSWAILFTFGPVYVQSVGLGVGGVGLFMGLGLAAGALAQFPLGWLSDAIGRKPTIALMCAGGTIASILGMVAHGNAILIYTVSLLAGALIYPLYGLAVALVNDAASPASRIQAAAGLVLLFGIGSIFGPLAVGWAIGVFGPPAFFGILVVVMASSLAAALASR
ncbi:MAG TPA: MFS transporter, partial [Rhizomicrobium sp.]|nr:MFS transporter [Rhizomicrobium sp.]